MVSRCKRGLSYIKGIDSKAEELKRQGGEIRAKRKEETLLKRIKRTIALLLCTIICFSAAMGDIVAVRADKGTVQETETDVGVPKPEENTTNIKEPETEQETPGNEQEESAIVNPTESEEQKEQPEQEESMDSTQDEPDQKPMESEPASEKTPAVEKEVAGTEPSGDTATSAAAPKSSAVVFTVENIIAAGIKDSVFAQKIYDSIIGSSDSFLDGNTLTSNPYTTMEELLKSYTGDIDANGIDGNKIQDLTGFPLLKSCGTIDLRNNQITDLRPISIVSDKDSEEAPSQSEKIYYGGGKGKNLSIYFDENPIRSYPKYVGGGVKITPDLTEKQTLLNDEQHNYITNGKNDFAVTFKIPLELYRGNDRVDLAEGNTYLFDDGNTGAVLEAPYGGRIAEIVLSGINKTGKSEVWIGSAVGDSFIYYYYLREGAVATNTKKYNPNWIIPFEAKIYTQVLKNDVSTKHSIRLRKIGQDDGEAKRHAVYKLYYQKGEVPNLESDELIGNFETDINGEISADALTIGNYYFVEDTAPIGYELKDDIIPFSVLDGRIEITSTAGNTLTPVDGTPQTIDGAFVLGGDNEEAAKIKIIPPDNGNFKSLKLDLTEGNAGGKEETITYELGKGTSTDSIIFVSSKEEAETKAVEQLKKAQKDYRNVKVSASFTQNIQLEQKDSLTPVDIELKAAKKLNYLSGLEIQEIPIGKFTFTLKNDPAYPSEPDIGIVKAVNGGENGKEVTFEPFSIGNEIIVNTPKDADGNYVYHYVISENNDGDPNYIYDSETVKAEVKIGKKENSDELEIKNIVYKKGTPETESNEFTNTHLTLPFTFKKVDGENKSPIKGTEFSIYRCNEGHTEATQHDEVATNMEGNCWKKYRTAVSNSNGVVDFGQLEAGEYRLVETNAADQYQKPTGQWKILVDVAGNKIIPQKANGPTPPPEFGENPKKGEGEPEYVLPNLKKEVMPKAGWGGTDIFYRTGVGIAALGTLLLLMLYAVKMGSVLSNKHKLKK